MTEAALIGGTKRTIDRREESSFKITNLFYLCRILLLGICHKLIGLIQQQHQIFIVISLHYTSISKRRNNAQSTMHFFRTHYCYLQSTEY